MADMRRKNTKWAVADDQGRLYSEVKDGAILATLLDIRDELQELNAAMRAAKGDAWSLGRTVHRIDKRLAKTNPLTRRRAR